MIPHPGQQLYRFGSRTVIRAVIHNQNRFAIFICQAVQKTEKLGADTQQQLSPIGLTPFQNIIGCVFTKRQVVVGCYAPEKIFPHKGQGEYGQNQGAHAMPMSFSNAALMERSSNFKLVEKAVNFAKNFNARLRFRINLGMYHLSPFCLILLCFLSNPVYIKQLGSSSFFDINSDSYVHFNAVQLNPES
jgi:hypothetical protein